MEETRYEGPLAEYGALRDEIGGRLQRQHQIHTLQLVGAAAVFGYALSEKGTEVVLLVVPVVSYLLGGRYVSQHYGIARTGTYLQELGSKIPGGMGWEDWLRRHRRTDRLENWAVPLFLTFPGAGLLATIWAAPHVFQSRGAAPSTAGLVALWLLDILAVAACARMFLKVATKPAWEYPHKVVEPEL